MTVGAWLQSASNLLADALIPSAQLDAQLILAHTLNKPRTWLHAHTDEAIDTRREEIADTRLQLRLERVPVAYIIGHKEFYGRRFVVTPATLIPRPESESLITLLLQHAAPSHQRLVDVGTGSGCLGITAQLELPQLDVTLLDTSQQALVVAQKNANLLGAGRVSVQKSNLLGAYPLPVDIIIANLPYVDREWETSPETIHEPKQALFADKQGLGLIYKLIDQAASKLAPGGLLLLEADVRQHEQLIEYATARGFHHVTTDGLAVLLRN